MKRNLKKINPILWSLFLFFSPSGMGQGSIAGTVRDQNGAPVVNAGMILIVSGEQAPVRYGYSDKEGQFGFDRLPYGKYTMEVSCLGYEKQVVTADSRGNQKIVIVLERQVVELNEVIIQQEKPVTVSNDTVTILTRYFTNGTEQNVEELLRKIPGVNIDEAGTIKIGNQEVEKVMVEGDDFFEKGYKLLTRNMAAYPVSKVEIYRNYSNNKHLKGIENSSKVALNLSLQEEVKSVWFGNGLAGYGGERYQVKGNLMNFGKKSKYYFLTHVNNTGQEVTAGLDPLMHSSDPGEPLAGGNDLPVRPMGSVAIGPPDLKKQRVTFNNARVLSLNSIFTLSDKVKLKTTGLIHSDRNSFERNSFYAVRSGEVLFENAEAFRGQTARLAGFGSADLTCDISATSTFRYTGKLSNDREVSRSELRFNSRPLHEQLYGLSRFHEHALHFTRKISQNKALLLTGRYFLTKTPQSYWLDPFIYQVLFPEYSGRVHQTATHGLQGAKVESCLMNKKENGDLLEVRWGGQWRKESLQSRYMQEGEEADEPGQLRNAIPYSSFDFYFSAKYLRQIHRLQLITQADFHRLFNNIGNKREQSGFFVVPRLGINYTISRHHKIRSSYTYTQDTPGIIDLYPQYIHTGFRTFSKGAEEFDLLNTSTAFINYTAGNWGNQFFLNTFLVYANNHNFFSTHTTLSPDYSLSDKIWVKGRETLSIYASADRYFKPLKANLKITMNGSKADFKNKVNGSGLRKVNTTHWVYGWENRSAFRFFLNYHIGSKWIQNRVRAETVSSFTDRTLFLDLDFRINPQLNVKAQAEQYYFGRLNKGANTCYFMDMEARYALRKYKLVLYFSGNNLFNTKTFRNYTVSDISVTRTEYRLQPRLLLLKAEYRF